MRTTSRLTEVSTVIIAALAGVSCDARVAELGPSDATLAIVAPTPLAARVPTTTPHAQRVVVKSLSDGARVHGSSATLMRRGGGLTVRVHTRELDAGESVDVLWAVFNRPDACTHPNPLTGAPCSPPDLFVAETLGSLHFLASLTADEHGKLSYSASLATGSGAGCVGDPFPCSTLTNPIGAEVHSAMFAPNGGVGRQAAQFVAR